LGFVVPESRPAAIALGSNLGDRDAHLAFAVARLRQLLTDLSVSPFIETAPVGGPPQPAFLNAAVVGRTQAEPRTLLASLLAIEQERHRERPHQGAPRTLDLDLILLGDLIVEEPDLHLPHPRFRERLFVLTPLTAIAPDLSDPVTGLTVAQLANKARARR
jgi:2-amino-4-hydroxy-6-hydroxymethyldihydropteridine diphosphokinase